MHTEEKFEFKKELIELHKKGIRDYSVKAEREDFVVPDAVAVVLPDDYGVVVHTAAKDFCDFMFISMESSARITTKDTDTPCVRIIMNKDEMAIMMVASSIPRDVRYKLCDMGYYNDAMKGYVMVAMREAGFDERDVMKVVRHMRTALDEKTAEEAEKIYLE